MMKKNVTFDEIFTFISKVMRKWFLNDLYLLLFFEFFIFLHIFIWFKISSLSQKWPHLQEDLIIKCLGDNDVTARTLVSI